MELKILSKNDKGRGVLEKLVKKKQRGVKIIGYVEDNNFIALFQFNKFLSAVSKGFEKYVLPQHKKFVDDYLAGEGLTKKDYEVIIK